VGVYCPRSSSGEGVEEENGVRVINVADCEEVGRIGEIVFVGSSLF
jgi:hypothetical protein